MQRMKSFKVALAIGAALTMLASAAVASAATTPIVSPGAVEEFRYSWRLRGGLAWMAGLRFPTSGFGSLRTTHETEGKSYIDSELLITSANGRDGFYMYQSHIDPAGDKTLMTYYGYAWGQKKRNERTLFDYIKRLARIRKEGKRGIENRVEPIPPKSMRDVLTGIYFLRQNAETITLPMVSEIYSDGKLYPVLYSPLGLQRMTIGGEMMVVRGYQISATPDAAKRWPGGVKVWLTNDERRVPVRIEIRRSLAALQFDLISMEAGR